MSGAIGSIISVARVSRNESVMGRIEIVPYRANMEPLSPQRIGNQVRIDQAVLLAFKPDLSVVRRSLQVPPPLFTFCNGILLSQISLLQQLPQPRHRRMNHKRMEQFTGR